MTIYWEGDHSFRDRVRDRPSELIAWGRCRSGRRWFWGVESRSGDSPEYGYVDTETEARRDAHKAIRRVTRNMDCDVMVYRHDGVAPQIRKQVNAARRRNREPSNTTDTAPVQYLYGTYRYLSDDSRFGEEHGVVAFRVTKKTAKRIYYIRRAGWPGEEPELGYVDRQALEKDGKVRNRGVHWSASDSTLHAEPPDLTPHRAVPPDLSQLRREMADAHPDRGGDREQFEAARARYAAAGRSPR